ncbi:TonB-dependent receptor [Acinetobacter puyangensis]|uniref:TonB-dependent receptor n=1 Tax=Acinetobacter puyangensis TaxID=1096779 RepID=UPI003A4E1BD5
MPNQFYFKVSILTISMICAVSQLARAEITEQDNNIATTQLPVIVVNAEQEAISAGQINRKSQMGLFGDKDVMEIPFSITSYSDKYIEDQQATSVAKALVSEPSVRNVFSGNGLGEYFNIRGLYTQSHELSWNGLFGLVPHNRVPTEFLERLEVFRGTSALLNGMSLGGAVGGVINVVPKRADEVPLTRLTTTFSSDANLGAHVDLGRRFGEKHQYGIRVNALRSHGDTSLDDQTEDRRLGSIALDYRGSNLRASLDLYDIREEYTGGMPLMVSFASANIPKAPDSTINTMSGADGYSSTKAAIANLEYDFAENWLAYMTMGTKHQEGYGYFANNALGRMAQANGDYIAVSRVTANKTDTHAAETGIRGQFDTGAIQHTLVLSSNIIDQKVRMGLNPDTPSWVSNIYAPTQPTALAARPTYIPKTSDMTLSSVALADTLSFLQEKYQLILGIRYQQVKSESFNIFSGQSSGPAYNENALTPALGVVVKPWDSSVSIYANYIEGLSQGDSVSDTTAENYGQNFAPYQSIQYEIGTKWDMGHFRNTLSVYQITKPTMIKNEATNRYSDDGEQRNRGVEWTTAGEIFENIRVLGGVVYMDAEHTKTTAGQLNGRDVMGIPHWQSNLGIEWDVAQLQGLTLSANTIYTGHMYADNANTQKLPDWTEVNLGGRYFTTIANHAVTFRGGIDNLFDQQHWAGVWNGFVAVSGTPRSYKFSMQIDF